jgi:hypothetical protein
MNNPRLILPSSGTIQSALPEDLDVLDASRIALLFALHESDITIDGIQINTGWLAPHAESIGAEARAEARLIEQAINRSYPEDAIAGLRINGICRARAAVHFLRALKLRSSINNAQRGHAEMALLKG